jgi:hypothetical protein
VSLLMKNSILLAILPLLAGCSDGKRFGNPQLRVTPETVIGRWSGLPKDLAGEDPGARDVKDALGQTIALRWEFKADHTFVTSATVDPGIVPLPAMRGTTEGTWKVLQVRGNTVTIELARAGSGGHAMAVFESKDKCIFDGGDGEAVVLTRLR